MKLYVKVNKIARNYDFELRHIVGGTFVLFVNNKRTDVAIQILNDNVFREIAKSYLENMFGEYNFNVAEYYLRVIKKHVFDNYLDAAYGIIAKQFAEWLLY